MTELGNSLMHGDISIKPYEYEGRKPCEYCEFKNICAYEDGVDQVEKIKKVSLGGKTCLGPNNSRKSLIKEMPTS